MSVLKCVTNLVQAGKITKALGDEALALYERSKGEFQKNMGPAEADAAAALATARAMEAGAKRLKNDVAKQAIAFANFERTMIEHPDGPIAGVLDQLTQSLRSAAPATSIRSARISGTAVGQVRREHGEIRAGPAGCEPGADRFRQEHHPRGVRGADRRQPRRGCRQVVRRRPHHCRGPRARRGQEFRAERELAGAAAVESEPGPQGQGGRIRFRLHEAVDGGGIARLWDTRNNVPATAAERNSS
jgi:hypothetical protein